MLINPFCKQPSISRQCELLSISRSSYYYKPKPIKPEDLDLMRKIDELYTDDPSRGSRSIRRQLKRQGIRVNRKRIQRLMRLMGIEAVYPKPRTTRRHPGHKVYPYLLRDMAIKRPNQVWAADITYVPMTRGFMYLVVVMDWYSRKILSWRVSNTMDADFCIEALQEALSRYGRPCIFNTDQGSQFTSKGFTGVLKEHNIKISMDVAVAVRTTSLSSGYGGPSSISIFIYDLLKMVRPYEVALPSGSVIIIKTEDIRLLTIRHRMRFTMVYPIRSPRQPDAIY